jgi:hypothetical protein
MAEIMSSAQDYMAEAFDFQQTLQTRMRALPLPDFERLLHPLFEQGMSYLSLLLCW